jgi:hypothetical protein
MGKNYSYASRLCYCKRRLARNGWRRSNRSTNTPSAGFHRMSKEILFHRYRDFVARAVGGVKGKLENNCASTHKRIGQDGAG